MAGWNKCEKGGSEEVRQRDKRYILIPALYKKRPELYMGISTQTDGEILHDAASLLESFRSMKLPPFQKYVCTIAGDVLAYVCIYFHHELNSEG